MGLTFAIANNNLFVARTWRRASTKFYLNLNSISSNKSCSLPRVYCQLIFPSTSQKALINFQKRGR